LSRQRRKIVDGLILEARGLADNASHPISESVVHEVEVTLQAALSDPRAADAVRTGRLVTALSSNGFDPVNLDGAVVLLTEPAPTRSTKTEHRAEPRTHDDSARLEAARAAVRDAAAETEQAEQALSAAEATVHSTAARVDELRSRVTELEAALNEARGAANAGDQDLRDARSARNAADHAVRAAHRRMVAAESQLERLEP
jgi:chromosome segregation ATPase